MITVEFRRPRRDERGCASGFRTVARLTVADGRVDVHGEEPQLVDREQRVVSLRERRPITLADDPEWARSLPGSFRSPYLWTEVVEDTCPPSAPPTWRTARLEQPDPVPAPSSPAPSYEASDFA